MLLHQSSTLSTLCRITLLHIIHKKNIALLQYLRLLHKIHCDKIALTLATKTCWLVWPVDPSPTHSLALFWHKRREPYHTVTILHSLHYNTVALLQKCIHCTLTGLHNLTATILHCCTIWLLPYCTAAHAAKTSWPLPPHFGIGGTDSVQASLARLFWEQKI